MDLGETISRALPEFRAHAESLMLDEFTVYTFEWVTVDGIEERVWSPQGTTPGKVSSRSRDGDTNTRTETVGGVERPVIEGGLHIPIGALVPDIGWEYELTTLGPVTDPALLGPVTDPALLGRVWRVVDVPAKSYATARRLDVVEIPQEDV